MAPVVIAMLFPAVAFGRTTTPRAFAFTVFLLGIARKALSLS